MQALLNDDGSGRLFVNNSEGPWSWEVCAPDLTSCVPFGKGREIATRGARPRTVFRVKSHGATGVSPEWRGRLKQLTPPTVNGIIRVNEFVSPVPGKWSGGWEGKLSEMQLSACATPEGQDCTTLTHLHYVRRCPASASFALDARFAGSYLRVTDRQIGAGPLFEPAYGISSPYGGEVWGRSRITSVAVVGQIAPTVSPYPGECGPPPPSEASISKRGVAFVECRGGCRAVLIARRDRRQARVARRLSPQNVLISVPPETLRLSPRALARIGAGGVRLIVKIDGKRVARRTVRLSAGG